jgi:hypothetical protein
VLPRRCDSTMIPDLEFIDVWLVYDVCRRDVGGFSAFVACLSAFVGVCRCLSESVGHVGHVGACRSVSEHVGARQSMSENVMSENVGGMSEEFRRHVVCRRICRLARY